MSVHNARHVLRQVSIDGLGQVTLRRLPEGRQDQFVFELMLNAYQSHCLRHWLDIRWREPAFVGTQIQRDPSGGSVRILRERSNLLVQEAYDEFDVWVDAIVKLHTPAATGQAQARA